MKVKFYMKNGPIKLSITTNTTLTTTSRGVKRLKNVESQGKNARTHSRSRRTTMVVHTAMVKKVRLRVKPYARLTALNSNVVRAMSRDYSTGGRQMGIGVEREMMY